MKSMLLALTAFLPAAALAQDVPPLGGAVLVPGFQGEMIEVAPAAPPEPEMPALQRDILLDLDGDDKPEQIMHFAEDCLEDNLCAWIVLPGDGMPQANGGYARQVMQAPAGANAPGEGYINADGILYGYDAGQVILAGDLISTGQAQAIPTTESLAGRVAEVAGFGSLDPSLIRSWRINLGGSGRESGTVSILPGNTMANGSPWIVLDSNGYKVASGWSIDWPKIYPGPTTRIVSLTAFGYVETVVEEGKRP